MATIDDLRDLGYDVGVAWGDVQTEQDALDAAKAAADPAAIAGDANAVTVETVQKLELVGRLPDDPDDRQALAAQIAASALETLTEKASERVDFHTRALEIAQEQPNVFHVASPFWIGYIACKDDGSGWDESSQDTIDGLAAPGVFAEGSWLAENPDAASTIQRAALAGVEVTRPRPGEDYFEAGGKTYTLAELVEHVEPLEPLPSTLEKVAAVLTSAPELSDATRKALLEALEG